MDFIIEQRTIKTIMQLKMCVNYITLIYYRTGGVNDIINSLVLKIIVNNLKVLIVLSEC